MTAKVPKIGIFWSFVKKTDISVEKYRNFHRQRNHGDLQIRSWNIYIWVINTKKAFDMAGLNSDMLVQSHVRLYMLEHCNSNRTRENIKSISSYNGSTPINRIDRITSANRVS